MGQKQRGLFDDPAGMARRTDPPTSFSAARRHARSGVRGANAAIVLAAVRARPGLTSGELASLPHGLERHEVSRRLADLEHAGLVKKGPARACTQKGRSMTTWYATEGP